MAATGEREDAADVIEKMVRDMKGKNAYVVLTRLQADLLLRFINALLNKDDQS